MKRRIREILPGQRYRKVGPGGGTWEVVAVRADASGATHARMCAVEDGKSFRTFATGVLVDPRSFQLVED